MKIKNIPTWKLKEIINENYNRGINGHDYNHLLDELLSELWKRENQAIEKRIKKELREYNHEKKV